MRLSAKRRADWLMSDTLYEGRQRNVRIGSTMLEVVEVGRGAPLVLVPGMAGGWRLLTPLARALARHHRVVLFGYRDEHDSLSSRPAEHVADHARDLARLIEVLGLERPSLFGVSFGGAVALEYAAARSSTIERLVLSGIETRFRATIASTIARRVLERYPLPADNPFVNQFFNLLHAGRPEAGSLARFVVDRCWMTDQDVIARRLAMLESFDVADRLGLVEVPTLVLAGERDAIIPAARQRALAQALPDAQFETLADAGHVAFLTHSADIAGRVARFQRGERASLT